MKMLNKCYRMLQYFYRIVDKFIDIKLMIFGAMHALCKFPDFNIAKCQGFLGKIMKLCSTKMASCSRKSGKSIFGDEKKLNTSVLGFCWENLGNFEAKSDVFWGSTSYYIYSGQSLTQQLTPPWRHAGTRKRAILGVF